MNDAKAVDVVHTLGYLLCCSQEGPLQSKQESGHSLVLKVLATLTAILTSMYLWYTGPVRQGDSDALTQAEVLTASWCCCSKLGWMVAGKSYLLKQFPDILHQCN